MHSQHQLAVMATVEKQTHCCREFVNSLFNLLTNFQLATLKPLTHLCFCFSVLMRIVEDGEPKHAGVALRNLQVILWSSHVGHIFVLRNRTAQNHTSLFGDVHQHCVEHISTYVVEE